MPPRTLPRKIIAPPIFKGYKPYGCPKKKKEVIELLFEEYEAIKLADYDCMHQIDGAKIMGISRPTFARIYETARKKIAQALVEGKEIKAVIGNAVLETHWSHCNNCNKRFSDEECQKRKNCPKCNSENIDLITDTL